MEDKWWGIFIPKTVVCLQEKYTWSLFRRDLFAGITVGVVALPLALAFGIASGVGPEKGLFTAIIAGFLISLLGGSRVQIGGPAGAFVAMVYGIVQRHTYEGLVVATLLAAVMLMMMGFCRLGNLIRYFPLSLIKGLTAGLGVIVFSLQVKDFFGLPVEHMPVGFFGKCSLFCEHLPGFDVTTLLLGLGTLGSVFFFRRFAKGFPWGIAVVILATLVSLIFQLDVETIYSRFGAIPRMVPAPTFPDLTLPKLIQMLPDACAIALLGGIESLLSAVVGDNLTGQKHKSNCELVAQGIANLGSILFGGIPATGTIARTATNVHSGAATPFAGMIHALTLLLLMLFFAPIVGYIPMAALAAVLMVVAWNLAEPKRFFLGFKSSKLEIATMVTTFSVILVGNLLIGVTAGMCVWGFGAAFQKWKGLAKTE
jgi:sulfate permease, SulP family